MRIRVFYISLAIWYRVLLYHYSLYLYIHDKNQNYVYKIVLFCALRLCSVLCCTGVVLFCVCCILLCSVFCICIDIYVCKCIIVHLCILYLCSVYCVLCMCACVCIVCVYCVRIVYVCVRYRLRFQLNPIPPMLVTYAGIW